MTSENNEKTVQIVLTKDGWRIVRDDGGHEDVWANSSLQSVVAAFFEQEVRPIVDEIDECVAEASIEEEMQRQATDLIADLVANLQESLADEVWRIADELINKHYMDFRR